MPISYQAQSPVLGLVLPSNSPGVHTLWLPIIPLQIGLVLKPGPQEPWTPYRMAEAFFQAGIPREAISIYPGRGDVGAAVLDSCGRSLIFGGTADRRSLSRQPAVQAHGPGFSQDPARRRPGRSTGRQYLDLMVDSVFINSGRGCINCSGIWASRHTREIADALAQRLAAVRPLPPEDPEASLAAFTVPGRRRRDLAGDRRRPAGARRHRRHGEAIATAARRQAGPRRLPAADRRALRLAGRRDREEGIHVPVRRRSCECPQAKMLEAIGPTLVCTAITGNPSSARRLLDAVHIDRLNLGPVPTTQLNWLQPHEGNIVDFLFRARAFQTAPIGA